MDNAKERKERRELQIHRKGGASIFSAVEGELPGHYVVCIQEVNRFTGEWETVFEITRSDPFKIRVLAQTERKLP